MFTFISLLLAAALSQDVLARDVPGNVRAFYDSVKPGSCSGSDELAGGFYNTPDSDGAWSYCQQTVAGKAIFIKTTDGFANMDIDCDGNQSRDDGRCTNSGDTQSQTSFQDIVQSYGVDGVDDLDANIMPYVVFGNVGNYYPTFEPTEHGIEPLSVMAVVCGDQLVYGVWGGKNGDDGPDPKPVVGEASLALATQCFGPGINGDSGHDGTDVLYIAFTGKDAVPGTAAKWDADSYDDFEASIEDLGNTLIQRLS